MPYGVDGFRYVLSPYGIVRRLLAHFEKVLSLLFVVVVPQAMEVGARHGVYHVSPEVLADLAVLVQNVLVELIFVDAREAVV
jgi:hypothetical protein